MTKIVQILDTKTGEILNRNAIQAAEIIEYGKGRYVFPTAHQAAQAAKAPKPAHPSPQKANEPKPGSQPPDARTTTTTTTKTNTTTKGDK